MLNQLVSSLRQIIEAYREVREVFKVVTDFNENNAEQVRQYVVSMAYIYIYIYIYSRNLQPSEFADEMIQ